MSAALTAASLSTAAAAADYRVEYRAYSAAIEAGDVDAATLHGEKAWRLAEVELGENGNTAALAVNYGQLVAETAPTKAAEAFDRAIVLAERGFGDFDVWDLRLRARLAHFHADPEKRSNNEALAAALDQYRAAGGPPTYDSALSAQRLAAAESAKGSKSDLRKATTLADAAVADARVLDPVEIALLRDSLMLAAITRIAPRERNAKELGAAVLMLDEAISLFPAQNGIDKFDRRLGKALAWRVVVGSIVDSIGSSHELITGSRIRHGEDLEDAVAKAEAASPFRKYGVTWATSRPETCTVEWKERKPPAFPSEKAKNGEIGAAVIGYDLVGDRVSRAIVLGEVGEFGEEARRSTSEWTLSKPVPAECGVNLLSTFVFAIVG